MLWMMLALLGWGAAPRPYTEFLRDVVNLERLTEPPLPGATCKQFSSYDRRSRFDPDTGQFLDWDANGDAGNFLREDAEGHVLAEMEGPGCIVRIWSANPQGRLKLFVDGALALEVDFLALARGEVPGIPEPLVGLHARGANCYLPIPYQKSCRVVVQDPGPLYYHVDYWTFPPETEVEPFHWPLREEEQRVLEEVLETLRRAGQPPHRYEGEKTYTGQVALAPGEEVEWLALEGPATLVQLHLQPRDLPSEEKAQRELLRAALLTLHFDDAPRPQVEVPLGDFFGTAPGVNLYRSLPLGMTEEGFYCYWPMPFQEKASLRLKNEGKQTLRLDWVVVTAPPLPGERLYFHAKWRRESPNRIFDWPMLQVEGRGRYVGAALHIWNPRAGWWGEGDEKVWVDGETFPSWFGTGSEDYFGYAWCSTQLFSHALHNQTLCEGPGNGNHTSVNRWHIADNIPFQRSFRITIENYAQDVDYACTAYWYAAQGSRDSFESIPLAQRFVQERWRPVRFPNVLEGEELPVVGRQMREVGPQDMDPFGATQWSNSAHLWLRPGGPGEWVEVALPVPEERRYRLVVFLTKARDYGIVRFLVNGRPVGQPFDGYDPRVVPSGPVDLGLVYLPAGSTRLRLEVIGRNPQSVGWMAGLDAVRLEPGRFRLGRLRPRS